MLKDVDEAIPDTPFEVEIVGEAAGQVALVSGLTTRAHKGADQVERTDIIIVPSVVLVSNQWQTGRYPKLTQ